MATWKKIIVSGSQAHLSSVTASNGAIISGSLFTTGSNTLIGQTYLTGSLFITGSEDIVGYLGLQPVSGLPIPTDKSASYIYTSGSTNDLYFTQYNGPYTNTVRLRWLEGNLYTGILYGGIVSGTPGGTTFGVSSGSGLIVDMNATKNAEPIPTIQYVFWPNFTNQSITNLATADTTWLTINSSGSLIQSVIAPTNGDFDDNIQIGSIIHPNRTNINQVRTFTIPSYAIAQQTYEFIRSFGPIKIQGHTLSASGSSLSVNRSSGAAFALGRNYVNDPNKPSYISDGAYNAPTLFRYYKSGSAFVTQTGTNVLDVGNYNTPSTPTGLSSVPGGSYTVQRVFYFPGSTGSLGVYYGRELYNSIANALQNYAFEDFEEIQNTLTQAIFVGCIIVKGNTTDLSNTNDAKFIQAGTFRNTTSAGGGGAALQNLDDLSNVVVPSPLTGDVLYYDGSNWINSKQFSGTYGVTGSLSISGSLNINGTSYTAATSGTSGTSGANGTSGTSGANGTSGTSGANGSSGSSGTSGTSGVNGSSGTSGANGSSGTSGANGADGSSGTSGANGSSGTSGANGSSGTSGTSGANGSSGTSGTSGSGFTTINSPVGGRILLSDGTTNAATASSNLSWNSGNQTLDITNGGIDQIGAYTSTFAGDVIVTGTLTATASRAVTASFASTASYWSGTVTSASYAQTASYWSGTVTSASYAQTSTTASYSNQEFVNVETLSADKTLTINDKPIQILKPNNVNRTITLPTTGVPNGFKFEIWNNSSYNSTGYLIITPSTDQYVTSQCKVTLRYDSSISTYVGEYNTAISIGGNTYDNYEYGVGVGNGTYNNNNSGVGVGIDSRNNYNAGVGIGGSSHTNYSGVGVGYNANNNYTFGLGLGRGSNNNYNYGVGVGASATFNYNYGVGVGASATSNAKGTGTVAIGAYSKAERQNEFVTTATDADPNQAQSIIQKFRNKALATAAGAFQEIFTDASSGRLTIFASSIYHFRIQINAIEATGFKCKTWEITGGIKRDASNNTTMVGGAPTYYITSEDSGTSNWDVRVTANDTNEALKIEVKHDSSNNVTFSATVWATETRL